MIAYWRSEVDADAHHHRDAVRIVSNHRSHFRFFGQSHVPSRAGTRLQLGTVAA
jgi:hypothetical protein